MYIFTRRNPHLKMDFFKIIQSCQCIALFFMGGVLIENYLWTRLT
jgi:hypothetical protein